MKLARRGYRAWSALALSLACGGDAGPSAAARRDAPVGPMHPAVASHLDERVSIPVLILMRVQERPVDKSELAPGAEIGALANRAAEERLRVEREALRLFAASPAVSASPRAVSVNGAFVAATLPPDVVRGLAEDPSVAFIGLHPDTLAREAFSDSTSAAPELPVALGATGTDAVHRQGHRGAGVKVAVLELGGLIVPETCFDVEVQDPNVLSDPVANAHASRTLALVRNRWTPGGDCSGAWTGYAPEAHTLLANGCVGSGKAWDVVCQYSWAQERGANVVSMSGSGPLSEAMEYGLPSTTDLYFDYWALRFPFPSFFVAAGNASAMVAAGRGQNFLNVGDILHDGNADPCDDKVVGQSSFDNPPGSDHELPRLAAPGTSHTVLGDKHYGTSAATPVVASIAAVLMGQQNHLRWWGEGVRAILLASANYQGADGADWNPGEPPDGSDGTGQVNAMLASQIAAVLETGDTPRPRAHAVGKLVAADFDEAAGSGSRVLSRRWRVRVESGDRVRVALAWNARTGFDPSGALAGATPDNLDLLVQDPNGAVMGSSRSLDGSYEFVEFGPSPPGDYSIVIEASPALDAGFWSYFGLAWTTHDLTCSSAPAAPGGSALAPQLRLDCGLLARPASSSSPRRDEWPSLSSPLAGCGRSL